MSGDTTQSMSTVELDGFIFRKSVPLRLELQEVLSALGETGDLFCLDIGGTNAMFSYQLRRAGGRWHTLAATAENAARLREGLETDVDVLPADSEPFAKHTFDAVVVTAGMLELQDSDLAFVKRCHQMLKPEGRLIVCVARTKFFSLINLLRRMLSVPSDSGYSESRLFSVLKNGFDVSSVRSYLRFFTVAVDAVVQKMAQHRAERSLDEQRRFYAAAGVFYWIAFQLDALLLLTRGHRLIAVANRRAWRSRDAPVLSDGRSISEAVLRTIG